MREGEAVAVFSFYIFFSLFCLSAGDEFIFLIVFLF